VISRSPKADGLNSFAGFENRGVGDHPLLTRRRHCPDFFGSTAGYFEQARCARRQVRCQVQPKNAERLALL
jgi:hypothetical protein